MLPTPTELLTGTRQSARTRESARVRAWRIEALTTAGWPPILADFVAANEEIDLHRACELVLHGCEPETAAAILL